MSRHNLITLLLVIASLLLAVALFIAGAIWRARTTARSAATDSRRDQFRSVQAYARLCPNRGGCRTRPNLSDNSPRPTIGTV
jgi:hypothetical protein